MKHSIEMSWRQLHAHLEQTAPSILADLNFPASDAAVHELENHLGVKLPADFIACWQIHNGQRSHALGLFNGKQFLSLTTIEQEWLIWKNLLESSCADEEDRRATSSTGIRPDWWNTRWIPFAADSLGNHLCIDLDPAPNGTLAQIIEVWRDGSKRQLLASDFNDWFNQFVRDQ